MNYRYIKVIIGLALLFLLFLHVDLSPVPGLLRNCQIQWLVLTALTISLSSLIGAYNLYILLVDHQQCRFTEFLPRFWFAWGMSLVTPGQVGDVASLPLLLKRFGIDWHQSLGKTLTDKLLSLSVMCLFACAGLYFSMDILKLDRLYLGILLLLVLVVVVLISLIKHRLAKVCKKELHGWRGVLIKSVNEITLTFKTRRKQVLLNFILSWLKVGLIGVSYWAAFRAYGIEELAIFWVTALMAVSALVAYLPISFNGIGTAEWTGVLLFSVLLIPEQVVLTTYLSMRLLVMILAWMPASMWLLSSRRSLFAKTKPTN